jgi:multidrug efflux system membrane fusion protein
MSRRGLANLAMKRNAPGNPPERPQVNGDIENSADQFATAESERVAPPHGSRKSKTKLTVVLIVIFALGGVVALRFGKHSQDPGTLNAPDQPVIVHAAVARQGEMGVYIDALGTVTPISTVNIYSQVSGRILAVHYHEGQIVHKGEPFIDIDPRPYQAQLQQAEGLLDHDKGVLNQAEIDLARYKDAFASHAVAKQVLDDQEQAVIQDQGAVKYDQGQVQYAEVQLSYCHIAAPAPGRVGLRLVDSGNTVFAGGSAPLAVITQLQPITVVFNVAEGHLREIQEQLRLHKTLAVEALDRSAHANLASGTLLTLDNQVDTSTGTVRFRGEFPNSDLALFPNEFVNAKLLVRRLRDSVLIPNSAIQRNGTQAFVFLVDSNKVSVRKITELSTDGKNTAVIGLKAGERVALSGFDKLEDGTSVTVAEADQDTDDTAGGGI